MFTVLQESESKLLHSLTSIRAESYYYYALHFHFSKLDDSHRTPYQIKIAVNIIDNFFKGYEGEIFLYKDSDVFVLYKGEDKTLLDKIIFQLRYLFVDDTLAFVQNGVANPNFCSVYTLAFQWQDFLTVCQKKMGPKESHITISVNSEDKLPISPALLLDIEKELPLLNLSQAMRNQPVCVVSPEKVTTIFAEFYISMAHLAQLFSKKIDLFADKLLFRYLTTKLDKYVLNLLTQQAELYCSRPISINLNMINLISDEFQKFDQAMTVLPKSSIVIEVDVGDVFLDIAGFIAAKEYLKNLGYHICLDGLNISSFVQLDREKSGFDLVKLKWHPDIERAKNSAIHEMMVAAVHRYGTSRIVLCNCDSLAAVEFGQSLGISLFQGWYIDDLLSQSKKQNHSNQ
jgi:EAL domain-containing protein (putative c-di-GMP-specific phosphodiesterase class I)